MKRGKLFVRAGISLLLSLTLCLSGATFAFAQELSTSTESEDSTVEGDADITLQAVGNRVYVNIAPKTDEGWKTFTLAVTWDENVKLVTADDKHMKRASSDLKDVATQVYNANVAGCFRASGAATSGIPESYAGVAYTLDFDTKEEMTVTCGDESVVINEAAVTGDADITLTAEDNKVYINIAPEMGTGNGWTKYSFKVMWDENVKLVTADDKHMKRASSDLKDVATQVYNANVAGSFAASGVATSGLEESYAGLAYTLEFDTQDEMIVTCGDMSVVINQAKFTVKSTDEGAALEEYTGTKTDVELPKEIEGEKLTMIGENAFANTAVEKVVIPETVTTIEKTAFADCDNLMSVTIPNSVTEIGDDAFKGCENVTICCYLDSVAYKYAMKNSIAVSLLDKYKYGDVNDDGSVKANDALFVLKDIVNLAPLSGISRVAADVSGNNEIEANDALYILQYVVDLINTFPADK